MRLFLASALLALSLVPAAAQKAELDENNPTALIEVPGFSVNLGMTSPTNDHANPDTPVVHIVEDTGVALVMLGESSGWETPQGSIEVLELDPTNGFPEVIFDSYTGGAHCCLVTKVARRGTDGDWKEIDVGMYDGGGISAKDVDGDGTSELLVVDNAFLYAFDCYACSAAPLKIFQIVGTEVKDVSAEPRFKKEHATYAKDLEQAWGENGGEKTPGYWAGWVAAKIRAGEGEDAWTTFKSEFDPATDQGVQVCAVDAETCPDDQWVTEPFPDALAAFLNKQGYPLAN